MWDAITHPRWALSILRSRRRTFGNLQGLVPEARSLRALSLWLNEQFDPTLALEDVRWARRIWPGQLYVKGILHPAEARQVIEAGADGVIISNHGGRQVDGSVSAVDVLPAVVQEVRGRGQILADGGIRSGVDVLKMLALGADGCMVGRAYLYGLGAMGGAGVKRALEILNAELDEHLALCGIRDVNDLPADLAYANEPPVTAARRASLL